MKFEITVLADDGDADDPGQLELGTVVITRDTEKEAVEEAHRELWDNRLNITSFPRYKIRELGEAPDTGQAGGSGLRAGSARPGRTEVTASRILL